MHSACFVRDIPPHEYAPGCIMLLLIIFALMGIGLLGMRVASVDGSSHFAARLYRTLTAMSFLFSLSSGVMFLGYAMPDFNAVSSTQEMLTVREWGYSQACVKEKMLNHAYVLHIVGRCCEIAVSLPLVFPRSCRLLLLVVLFTSQIQIKLTVISQYLLPDGFMTLFHYSPTVLIPALVSKNFLGIRARSRIRRWPRRARHPGLTKCSAASLVTRRALTHVWARSSLMLRACTPRSRRLDFWCVPSQTFTHTYVHRPLLFLTGGSSGSKTRVESRKRMISSENSPSSLVEC